MANRSVREVDEAVRFRFAISFASSFPRRREPSPVWQQLGTRPHLRGGRLCAGMTYLCRYATKVIRRVRLDAPFSQVVRQDAPYKSYSLRFSDRPKFRNELCFFGDDFAGLSGFGSVSAKPTC